MSTDPDEVLILTCGGATSIDAERKKLRAVERALEEHGARPEELAELSCIAGRMGEAVFAAIGLAAATAATTSEGRDAKLSLLRAMGNGRYPLDALKASVERDANRAEVIRGMLG